MDIAGKILRILLWMAAVPFRGFSSREPINRRIVRKWTHERLRRAGARTLSGSSVFDENLR